MKAVVQRVSQASVSVSGKELASIGRGLVVLLGVAAEDGPSEVAWMARKLARLRIFSDHEGLMNLSLIDIGGEALVVSQFTLIADTRKGNRPGFSGAAQPDLANPLYLAVVEDLRKEGVKVKTGEFGASMQVELTNDGPVTILLESTK